MLAIQNLFGGRVRELREARGLSQESLAGICGLHRTYIGLIERGERNLSLGTVEVVAQGLGVPVAELFSGIPVSPPPKKGHPKARFSEMAELSAHIETIKQILIEAKLSDARSYEAALKAVRSKRL
jgi:transcriptional regulator with XRE-family HTH domain